MHLFDGSAAAVSLSCCCAATEDVDVRVVGLPELFRLLYNGAIPGGCHLWRSKLEPPEVVVTVAEGCQTQPVRAPAIRAYLYSKFPARACMLCCRVFTAGV